MESYTKADLRTSGVSYVALKHLTDHQVYHSRRWNCTLTSPQVLSTIHPQLIHPQNNQTIRKTTEKQKPFSPAKYMIPQLWAFGMDPTIIAQTHKSETKPKKRPQKPIMHDVDQANENLKNGL